MGTNINSETTRNVLKGTRFDNEEIQKGMKEVKSIRTKTVSVALGPVSLKSVVRRSVVIENPTKQRVMTILRCTFLRIPQI